MIFVYFIYIVGVYNIYLLIFNKARILSPWMILVLVSLFSIITLYPGFFVYEEIISKSNSLILILFYSSFWLGHRLIEFPRKINYNKEFDVKYLNDLSFLLIPLVILCSILTIIEIPSFSNLAYYDNVIHYFRQLSILNKMK